MAAGRADVQAPPPPVLILFSVCLLLETVDDEIDATVGALVLAVLLLLEPEPSSTFLLLFFRIFRCFFKELVGVLLVAGVVVDVVPLVLLLADAVAEFICLALLE